MGIRAGIVGFRGYSGAELVHLLKTHPVAEPVLVEHRSDAGSQPLPRNGPAIEQIALSEDTVRQAKLDVVFLATPHDVSMELTPWLLTAGVRVIDLSGAFRLGSGEAYKRWYKDDHTAPQLFGEAVYGLPEFGIDGIRKARLLSNPGCYPTAASLAIRPLLEAGFIDRSAGVVCDAKSGVSGAGRKPSMKTSFCEVTENFSAYSLLDHRHVPEVIMNTGLDESEFSFVAQLIPIDRGILETIYFRGNPSASADAIVDAYERFYAGRPFVRIYDPGVVPDLRAVQRTNFCDLGVKFDPATRRGVVVSVIDNIGKGAAGQAVQNMNIMFGLDEGSGLL